MSWQGRQRSLGPGSENRAPVGFKEGRLNCAFLISRILVGVELLRKHTARVAKPKLGIGTASDHFFVQQTSRRSI